ncbi:hypothetical protein R3I93_020055 [Phoxinus phoxinus]|uniref:Uncharacterized protein n=1 Tax=Phoxinus phoxinus TaxID=58324 RepID=A0AAN9C942_9TELE
MEEQMYHNAEIYLPRKKKVLESFQSNTFRIFDETVPERLDPVRVDQNQRSPARDPQDPESRNTPHPQHSRFIRTNVRFLNEPIAHMDTQQCSWWSDSPEEAPPVKPAYSEASTQRRDFQPIRDSPVRARDARPAARGIIPALSSMDLSEKLQNK